MEIKVLDGDNLMGLRVGVEIKLSNVGTLDSNSYIYRDVVRNVGNVDLCTGVVFKVRKDGKVLVKFDNYHRAFHDGHRGGEYGYYFWVNYNEISVISKNKVGW